MNFKKCMSVIRENLTKEFIVEIIDCYIDDFQEDIEVIFTNYPNGYCTSWFINSEENKLYRNLRRWLKVKKRKIRE